jgi:dsDNA-binding SOS-regulon protein
LKGNHAEKERLKLRRGEARLDIMSKAHEDRLAKMQDAGDKLLAKIKQKEVENGKLVSI